MVLKLSVPVGRQIELEDVVLSEKVDEVDLAAQRGNKNESRLLLLLLCLVLLA